MIDPSNLTWNTVVNGITKRISIPVVYERYFAEVTAASRTA